MSSVQLKGIKDALIMNQTEGALLMSTNISGWLKAASVGLRKWLIRQETCCGYESRVNTRTNTNTHAHAHTEAQI